MTEPTILATSRSPRGDLLLRERVTDAGLVTELVVNGVFAMDSTETSSEREMAALVPAGARRVLVGGLGLGYTVTALLDRYELDLRRVDVVELEPALVSWAQAGLTTVLAAVAADGRVRLHVGDVAQVLSGLCPPEGPWDAVLLDVDNGPDFLIHDVNAALYQPPLLTAAYRCLRPGGVLALWCQGPSPELASRLRAVGCTHEHHHRVSRASRTLTYVVYTVERTPDGAGQNGGHG